MNKKTRRRKTMPLAWAMQSPAMRKSANKNFRRGSQNHVHNILSEKSKAGLGFGSIVKYEVGEAIRSAIVNEVVPAAKEHLWTLAKERLTNNTGTSGASETGSQTSLNPGVVQEFIHPPISRNLIDNKTYFSKVELHHGTKNRLLRQAMKRYPSSSQTLWQSTKEECADMIFQCHGINQTGFWAPYTLDSGVDYAPNTYDNVNRFMVNANDLYKMMSVNLSTDTYTAAQNLASNADLLWAWESTTSTNTFRNASELTPTIITCYVIKAKRTMVGEYPYSDLSEDEYTDDYMTTPTLHSINDQDSSTRIYTDTAAWVGYTPQMSRNFKSKWDVVDVIKSPVLNPGDQWRLEAKEYFSKPKSWQTMKANIGATPSDINIYIPGDYELLIQFTGAPGFAENELSGVVGYTRVSTYSNPNMITCTQKRSHQTRFQAYSYPQTLQDGDQYLAAVERTLFDGLDVRISPYFGDSSSYNWRAVGMTNTTAKVANADGIEA